MYERRLRSALVEQFHPELVFPFAAAIGLPLAGESVNFAAMREPGEFGERFAEDLDVTRAVVRRSESPADGMIDEGAARRRDARHNVERGADHERRDPAAFYDMRNETDGLVTKRSVRNQEDSVDVGGAQFRGDRGSERRFDFLMALEAAHERDMEWRHTADNAFVRQRRKRCARKDDLGILPRHPADSRMMIDDDRSRCGIGRHQTVTGIVARNERRLLARPQRRARQQRDSGLRERFLKPMPSGL